MIAISGDIDRTTREQFVAALNDPKMKVTAQHFSPLVRLNSKGGDVVQAIEIGRTLRNANLSTGVFENDECSSACVLILAAGVNRIADYGRVGIHRPHFDEQYFGALTPTQARERYEGMSNSVRQYLADMGSADTLYRDMLKVSSDDVKYLSAAEMRSYGLIGQDPAWAEYDRARAIRSEGRTQYDVNQSFFAVLTACFNSGLGTDTCDRDARQLFELGLDECTKKYRDEVACAKSVERRLVAMYQQAGR